MNQPAPPHEKFSDTTHSPRVERYPLTVDHAIFISIVGYLVFMFSVVCHEAGHAVAAMLGGDRTAYHNGQVTLNPVPHVLQEPFGLGLLPVLSLLQNLGTGSLWIMGFASAPFDLGWAMMYPRRAAWMAMAGPATNFLIALAAGVTMKIGLTVGWFTQKGSYTQLVQGEGFAEPIAILLSAFFYLNFALGCFNLIPIPPLDGFSILLFFVPTAQVHKIYELRSQYGMLFPLAIFFLSGYLWDLIDPFYVFFARLVL